MSNRGKLPINAIFICAVLTGCICLINIGSTVAFNAIISLTIAGLYTSYFIAVILMLRKRLLHEPIEFGPWTMGRFGIVVNMIAAAFLTISIVFSFFPPAYPVTPQNMNWSCVVFGGEMILGGAWFVVRGRKQFNGPVFETGFE